MDCPLVAFKMAMEPSEPPAAILLPSGDQATSMTGPACPQYATSRAEGVGVPVDGQVGVVGVGIRVAICVGVVASVGVGDGPPCVEPLEEAHAASKTNRK